MYENVTITKLGKSSNISYFFEFKSKSQEDLKKAIHEYYKNFHPAGYGTFAEQIRYDDKSGYYISEVYRASNCD